MQWNFKIHNSNKFFKILHKNNILTLYVYTITYVIWNIASKINVTPDVSDSQKNCNKLLSAAPYDEFWPQ